MMSQSHRIKGGTTDEVFKEQCFLWERGASVGADFLSFKISRKRYSTEQTCDISTHFAPDWTGFCLFNLLYVCVVFFHSTTEETQTFFLKSF